MCSGTFNQGFPLTSQSAGHLEPRHWSLSAQIRRRHAHSPALPSYDILINQVPAVADAATAWMISHWRTEEGNQTFIFLPHVPGRVCRCVRERLREKHWLLEKDKRKAVWVHKCVQHLSCPVLWYHVLWNESFVLVWGWRILCHFCLILHSPAFSICPF